MTRRERWEDAVCHTVASRSKVHASAPSQKWSRLHQRGGAELRGRSSVGQRSASRDFLISFYCTRSQRVLTHSAVQVKVSLCPWPTDARIENPRGEFHVGILDASPHLPLFAFVSLGCASPVNQGSLFELQGLSYQGHFHNQTPSPLRSLSHWPNCTHISVAFPTLGVKQPQAAWCILCREQCSDIWLTK